MEKEYKNSSLVNNKTQNRFEIVVNDSIAFIDYTEKDKQVALVHTEVPEVIGGKGVAAALVEKTLYYLENNNKSLLPLCPYVFAYIKRHPEWKRIVDERFQGYNKL